MKKQEAEKLLNTTFNKEFDRTRFANFFNELFNGFYVSEKNIGTPKEYEQHISSIKKLGNFKANDGSMEIFVVKLKKGSILERARTLQRNVIAKLLKGLNIDSALAAFYSEDSPDWRFSFIKMDYKLLEDGKVSTELTPAKRHSFLVGPNEPNHTCRKQFLDLVCLENQKPNLDEIEKAFSVEIVTKEFFEKYKNLFISLKENLEKLVEKDYTIKEEFEKKRVSVVEFAKKLLGQIVFLYFLQKKGWLGVKRQESGKFESWGKGPRRFVQELFEQSKRENKNFFNDYLEHLFYEALAEDRRANGNYYGKFDCMIPFLNGGLFEPINGYNWQETNINIDNTLFEEIFRTFDEFNFTIKEDEPLEKEVAVDPEMLGKVFENLLDVIDRKSKGAFYTPREIVHYMCQQSLINYLETNSKLPREDLEIFITKGDLALDYLKRMQVGGRGVKDEFILPKSIYKNQELLDNLLKSVKIVDPAVGSGAFPVGMMNEIIKAREILDHFIRGGSGKSLSDYDLKRETIENSLYGVDIEPSAVEITKLRFWLSLIVDEEDMENVRPLPNLENRIMCGNSLIEEFKGVKLYKDPSELQETQEKQATLDDSISKRIKKSEEKLRELRRKQKEFFDEENRMKKKQLRADIEKIEWEFIEETLREQENAEALKELEQYKNNKSKPFFLWKLYFNDVFYDDKGHPLENPGFDIVIGNPPYVSAVKHSKENATEREYLREKYKEIKGSFDLYAVFLLKGLDLIKKKGAYSWIIPNKFLISDYSKDILARLEESGLYCTIDVSKYNVFHDIGVYPIILLGDEEKKNKHIHFEVNNLSDLSDNNLTEYKEKFSFETFKDFGIKIGSGTTGFQAKQIIPLIKNGENADKEDIPFAVSGSIDPYLLDTKNVRYMGSNYHHPKISFDPKILAKSKWIFWKNPKIVVAGMTKRIEAYYTENPLALGVGCYALFDFAKFNSRTLLGILNSKFITYFLNIKFKDKHLAGGYLAINKSTIEQLPLKDMSEKDQKPFIEIVDKILDITKGEDYLENSEKQAKVKAYERQIDKIVYDLYELTPEEIKIVEGFGENGK
jgi:adenine-specific DNA-methyltransferase